MQIELQEIESGASSTRITVRANERLLIHCGAFSYEIKASPRNSERLSIRAIQAVGELSTICVMPEAANTIDVLAHPLDLSKAFQAG